MNPHRSASWLILFALAAPWLPAMLASVYAWKYTGYYDYGWFVPPAALVLAIRRWDFDAPVKAPHKAVMIPMIILLLPLVSGFRILGYADPSWRLPMIGLGMTAAISSHLLLADQRGWRQSFAFYLVTAFLLSAVPWPTGAEKFIVRLLTGGVIHAVAEVFQLFGRPVEVLGDRLQLNDLVVEVTDGCSGVRSFQSFLMASLFFSELHRLKFPKVMLLVGCACIAAFVINVLRAYSLADIRFTRGEAAFHQAHDWLGLTAFLVTAGIFYLISEKLADESPRRVVRIVRVS